MAARPLPSRENSLSAQLQGRAGLVPACKYGAGSPGQLARGEEDRGSPRFIYLVYLKHISSKPIRGRILGTARLQAQVPDRADEGNSERGKGLPTGRGAARASGGPKDTRC